MEEYTNIIQVMDCNGNYYNNAYVENDFDAIMICKFYREELGYKVKLIRNGQDMTFMTNTTRIVKIKDNE